MKAYKLVIAAVLPAALVMALSAGRAAAQNVQNFTIDSFSADYYLDRNAAGTSTLHTVEVIKAIFPDLDQNHGILRAIPETYNDHTISLIIDSVTDENNRPLHYTSSGQNGNLVLKIGDAGTYVHGLQTYKITYDARNVAALFSDHDEFYWNVNGNQWQQPIAGIEARIHIPKSLKDSLQNKYACYAGAYGSNDSSRCRIVTADDLSGGSVVTASASNLTAGETLTAVAGFNKNTFRLGPEIAREERLNKIKTAAAIVLAVLPPVAAAGMMWNRWRKFGDDPKGRGVIIPQYEPPKGLDALSSQYILKESFSSGAFSALIIQMATGRHITISEIPKKGLFGKTDYQLVLNSTPADLSPTSRQGLGIIFGSGLEPGSQIKISELRDSKAAYANSAEFKRLSDNLASALTALGYFIKNPSEIKKSYRLWAIAPLAAGLLCLFALAAAGIIFAGLGTGLVLAALVMFGFAHIMPARSLAGVEARDELLGLKDFIKLAEADRLKFLQSPQGAEKIQQSPANPDDPVFKVKLFESLLPYAMIFGLEKEWAKQFKDIYTTPPDWYHGNWSTFNTLYLANSLSGFSNAGAVSFSPPASSGSSGFGGGGFSGGGGGGGGGGGW